MKTYYIEIYTPGGDLLVSRWKEIQSIEFRKELNGGLSDCTINIGEKFDWSSNTLALNNQVKIWVVDKDTDGLGTTIYNGYISNCTRALRSGEEVITITLLGYYTKLAQDIWKNGSTTTFDYSASAEDIGSVMKTAIGQYITNATNPKINFDVNTIDDIGTDTNYKFESVTYKEAIDKLQSMSPAGYFWYVDENNTIKLDQKPGSPTHTFVLGKHLGDIKLERSIEKIKNAVLFYDENGSTLSLYSDTESVREYGRRVEKMKESRAGSSDTSNIANAYVNNHKDPSIKITASIIDNNTEDDVLGYDIESINPGDTCTFVGFDDTINSAFDYNMMITEVRYTLSKVDIIIETLRTGVNRRTENINKRLDAIELEGVPTSIS